MDEDASGTYRLPAMGTAYMSQNRIGLQYATGEMATGAQQPNEGHQVQL